MSTEMLNIDQNQIEAIVREAGTLALEHFGSTEAEFKGGESYAHSIVTVADRAVEKLLLKKLVPLFPGHQFYGEETGVKGEKSDYIWYIDPIDGTSNFARNNPAWSISVGLAYKEAPVFGVMYFPVLDEYFEAQKGQGAWLNKESITASDRPMDQAVYMVGSVYHQKVRRYSEQVAQISTLKSMTCATFSLSQVARGDAEIYTANTYQPYDVCAGIIVAQEAGAIVTTGNGQPWTTESEDLVVANDSTHAKVIELLEAEQLFQKTKPTLKK